MLKFILSMALNEPYFFVKFLISMGAAVSYATSASLSISLSTAYFLLLFLWHAYQRQKHGFLSVIPPLVSGMTFSK